MIVKLNVLQILEFQVQFLQKLNIQNHSTVWNTNLKV